jgi:hypothetical protein
MTDFNNSREVRTMRRTTIAFFAVVVLILVALHQKARITHEMLLSQETLLAKIEIQTKNIDEQTNKIAQALAESAKNTSTPKAEPTPIVTPAPAEPKAEDTPEATSEATKTSQTNTSTYQTANANYQQAILKARQLLEQQRIKAQPTTPHFTIAQNQATQNPQTAPTQSTTSPSTNTVTTTTPNTNTTTTQAAIPTPSTQSTSRYQ